MRTSRSSRTSWRVRPIPRSASRSGSSRPSSSTRRCRSSGTGTSSAYARTATPPRASTRKPSSSASTTCGSRNSMIGRAIAIASLALLVLHPLTDFALLTKQQLEDVGFVIDLQVVDWATLVKRRNNSKEYDAFTTGIGAIYDPAHVNFLTASWPGWTTDEDILKLQAEMARETDPKKRMAMWEQQTRQVYEKVPIIRYGDLAALRAIRNTTKGFDEKTQRVRFTNVWVEK